MKKVLMMAAAVVLVSAMVGVAEEPAVVAAPVKECPKAASCLSVKDGVAMSCACASKCDKCLVGEVKEGKCVCGKEVTKTDLVGKFVCEKCKVISEKAGKCACGADLVEVKAKVEEVKAEAVKVEAVKVEEVK